MFDLPRTSQEPLPTQTPRTVPEWGAGAPLPPAPLRDGSLVPTPEDWGFLRDFGDASDEFFELDVQLRGLLDGGFESEGVGVGFEG